MDATMNTRRYELLDGKLETPKQIEKLVNHDTFDRFFQSLWFNYLRNPSSTTSAPYWMDEFDDKKAFNRALQHLSKAGWIESVVIPGRNWSTLRLLDTKLHKWVTPEELIDIRKYFKFNKYKMSHTKAKKHSIVRTPKCAKNVGISRPGSAKAGNNTFRYDIKYLDKYYDAILLNTTKSIQRAIDKHQLDLDGADYKSVAIEILEYHRYSANEEFTMGTSHIDSRGRAISESLSKVFNLIGYKDARALLIGPAGELSRDGYGQIYLSIAELLGYKPTTLATKMQMGHDAYNDRKLHNLDLTKESDRAELHENIWLERIYDNLDEYDERGWNVPLEIDATASVIQVMGSILGDYNMLDEVNVANPEELKDVWTKGMPRKQFKEASTPLLYGSTQSCRVLWTKGGFDYTEEHVAMHKKELASGVLGLANDFKDYIIDNVTPLPEMDVVIGNEKFKVYCNKYMRVGDYVKKYPLYDTDSESIMTVNHTHTTMVPDLEQFKRYMVTLLVHNLDSQLMDNVCLDIDWILPIYDAAIVMPWDAIATKKSYGKYLDNIIENRVEIREKYFESIGIRKTNGSVKQWEGIMRKITPINDDFKCSIAAMK